MTPDEYPHPRPRHNGNGVAFIAVIIAFFMIVFGVALSQSQSVQEYQCGINTCTVTNLPVTGTYGP